MLVTLLVGVANKAQGQSFFNQNNKTASVQPSQTQSVQFAILRGQDFSLDVLNLQVGCSPIKHLSLSGGYVLKHESTSFVMDSKTNEEFVIAIGTYYFFNHFKNKKSKTILNEGGVLFNFNTGVAKTKIQHSSAVSSVMSFSNVDYNTFFLQYGLHLKFVLGHISISNTHNRLNYTKIFVAGSDYPSDVGRDIQKVFNNQSTFWANTFNVELQLGLKNARFLCGVKMEGANFFNSRNLLHGNGYVYIGLIGELVVKNQNKK